MYKQPIIVERDRDGALQSINLVRPSNWHAHFRDGPMLQAVARDILIPNKYVLAMPNTGPIDNDTKLLAYYNQLLEVRHRLGLDRVEIVMTIYLTNQLDYHMVGRLAKLRETAGLRVEVKYYPPHPGATTGSGHGIPLDAVPRDTWRAMVEYDTPLLGHFESPVDHYGHTLPMADREAYFMAHEFPRLRDAVPNLKICIEHASTRAAIARVKEDPSGKTVCGLTPHHLILSIEDLMQKSWRNHGRCMPIPKSSDDVVACREFATSGDRRVIAGDDTAPHPSRSKQGPFDEAACGCWLPHALALYAYAFEMEGALDERFANFACYNGADWRELPRPSLQDRVRLVADTERDIPDPLAVPALDDEVIPLGWTKEPDRLKIGLAHALEEALTT